MIGHDAYGKLVLKRAYLILDERLFDAHRRQPICEDVSCEIDGVIGGRVAVEIESRTPKQVRGAWVDLILHPAPLKLMVLIPAYIGAPDRTRRMCREVFTKLDPNGHFGCVVLSGKGDSPQVEVDALIVADAVRSLDGAVTGRHVPASAREHPTPTGALP